MSDRVHPLEKLDEYKADCASGAWNPATGNYWAWFSVCYPHALIAGNAQGIPTSLLTPQMKREIPPERAGTARAESGDDEGWNAIIAKMNAQTKAGR